MSRPRLLDLFCGAGGAAMGYHRAGFDVVGVDIKPQANYPFDCIQSDVFDYLSQTEGWLSGWFAAIHASPPCQAFSKLTGRWNRRHLHQDLVGDTRQLLVETGLPYVIENVPGSPLRNPTQLCGSWFGLDIQRHRWFETDWPMMSTPCSHYWQRPRFRSLDKRQQARGSLASVIGVHGHLNYAGERQLREQAMGIDWMTPTELVEAIPPAYTEFIGAQLLEHLRKRLGESALRVALSVSRGRGPRTQLLADNLDGSPVGTAASCPGLQRSEGHPSREPTSGPQSDMPHEQAKQGGDNAV